MLIQEKSKTTVEQTLKDIHEKAHKDVEVSYHTTPDKVALYNRAAEVIESGLFPLEYFDIVKPLEFGQNKYGKLNWMCSNGTKCSRKQMLDSTFHHLAQVFCNQNDHEMTGVPPAVIAANRMMMYYTRTERGLVHPDDAT